MNGLELVDKMGEHDVKIEAMLLFQGTDLHQDLLEQMIHNYDNEELSNLIGDEDLFRGMSDTEIYEYFNNNHIGDLIAEVHTPVKKPFGRRKTLSWSWATATLTLIIAKDMEELVEKSCKWADEKEEMFRKGFEKEMEDGEK